jgi:hypothetical protein
MAGAFLPQPVAETEPNLAILDRQPLAVALQQIHSGVRHKIQQ